jgi:tetratricopeptide (TPR) repeat protein
MTDDAGIATRKDDPLSDLLVESLFYRLRADPRSGYIWYLKQADSAFRMVKAGFEMRLRDAMAQFAVNANPKGKEDSASSEIDRANIETLMPYLWQQFQIDSAMMWVRRLSFRGRHEEAVRVAEKAVWAKRIYLQNKLLYCSSYAELGIWRAQSLMYLGNIQDASAVYKENLAILEHFDLKKMKKGRKNIDEYELKRICFLKGRTHNNLGYTYWMYLGKNKAALMELLEALKYFEFAGLTDEEATTLDNMGRIHATLWHQPPAQLHIEEGLKMREQDRSKYRVALSQISLASIQHRFGNPQQALENVNKAYETFMNMSVERGKGLAYLTRAMIQRSAAETGREAGASLEKPIETTNAAISDLTNALRIFKVSVQETIRYVYALNEMGSCYRCLYLLQTKGNAPKKVKQATLKEGIYYYMEAIKHAEKHGYFIEELDSRQDLAVLYFRANENEKALQELNQILDEVPREYKLLPNARPKNIPDSEVTDAYFKLMGQVESLIGAIVFDRQVKSQIDLKTALDALEHYLLSVAYYYRYSSVSSNTYIRATERIYKRFSQCDRNMRPRLAKHVDKLIAKYRIPPEWAKPLFNQVFVMLGVYPDK